MIGVITGIIIFALCIVFFFVGENAYRLGLSVVSIIVGLFTAFYLFLQGHRMLLRRHKYQNFKIKRRILKRLLVKKESRLMTPLTNKRYRS